MEFEIRKEYPPNIEEIRKVFYIGSRHVVYTYGVVLYNPSGKDLPNHLLHHEKIHQKQQLAYGVEKWWEEYLRNPEFRLEQELEAYTEQYAFVKEKTLASVAKDFLTQIASDLASNLYGNMVKYDKAESMIRHRSKLLINSKEHGSKPSE